MTIYRQWCGVWSKFAGQLHGQTRQSTGTATIITLAYKTLYFLPITECDITCTAAGGHRSPRYGNRPPRWYSGHGNHHSLNGHRVSQTITLYTHDEQKSISEGFMFQALRHMSFSRATTNSTSEVSFVT